MLTPIGRSGAAPSPALSVGPSSLPLRAPLPRPRGSTSTARLNPATPAPPFTFTATSAAQLLRSQLYCAAPTRRLPRTVHIHRDFSRARNAATQQPVRCRPTSGGPEQPSGAVVG